MFSKFIQVSDSVQWAMTNTAIGDNYRRMYLQEGDYFIVCFETEHKFRFESMKPLKYLTYFAPKSA